MKIQIKIAIASVLSLTALAVSVHAEEKPNILFLFADDQAVDTIGAYGNTVIDTPNIDRLASQGARFTSAYNMGSWSGAVCVASRTMLNTGRFLWKANAVYGNTKAEREAGRFWSEYMKKAGYETYFTGKWHVRADANKAFDHAANIRGGMPNQTNEGYNRPIEGKKDVWSPYDTKFGGFWKGGKHWSEVVAEDAIGFLKHAKKSEKPFFMYIAFNAAHDPRQSPKEHVDKYPLEKVQVPVDFVTEYPHNEAMASGRRLRDERLAPFPRTEYSVKVNRQEYFALVDHMDVQIGRILDTLKETGKADSTYIFYSADHGLACGHHGLMGKQNMFEHSVQVPLLASGPGIKPGQTIDGNVYLQDIMATSLELAGVQKPDHVDFKSLLPVLHGQRKENYSAVYGAYLKAQRMVNVNDMKLILYPANKTVLLFDLKNDPHEMKNLADDQPETVHRLFARLLELQKETADELDLRAAFPDLAAKAK